MDLTDHAARGELGPPGFDDWTALFRDGFKSLVFVALPIYIFTSLVSFAPVAAAAYYTNYPLDVVGWLAYLVSLALWLYLAPPLLVNYSVHRSVREAYDLGELSEFVSNPSYQVYFLGSLVLGFALVIVVSVVSLLSLLTLVGWLFLVPAAVFYGYAVMAAYWGRVYYKTMPAP